MYVLYVHMLLLGLHEINEDLFLCDFEGSLLEFSTDINN